MNRIASYPFAIAATMVAIITPALTTASPGPPPHFEPIPRNGPEPAGRAFETRCGKGRLRVAGGRLELRAAAGEGHPTALAWRFLDTGAGARTVGADRLPGHSNYYRGSNPARWRTRVPHYSTVAVDSLYPGTDLRLEAGESCLSYALTLKPGANPAAIRFTFPGADDVSVGADGALRVSFQGRSLRQSPPLAFQRIGGDRISVPVAFQVAGKAVRFELGEYDADHPLIIDPTVAYGGYVGGSQNDFANDFNVQRVPTTGGYGELGVMVGQVRSIGLPSSGTPFSGSDDFYAFGFNTDTGTFEYATYH